MLTLLDQINKTQEIFNEKTKTQASFKDKTKTNKIKSM